MISVGQVLDTLLELSAVTIYFDEQNKQEFENGDFMLTAFRDYAVDSMVCYVSEGPRGVPGLQLNIKMLHEPVKVTA